MGHVRDRSPACRAESCRDKPLSLLFSPFESIVLFLSVLLVNVRPRLTRSAEPGSTVRITHAALVLTASAVADSRANWLEGWLLMMCYLIVSRVALLSADGADRGCVLVRRQLSQCR